ncbi:hypothetical protein [uncultured Dysosmobacter sp.]|uniref:hypothetical protein n=1 Tax=uncultured Dysosmobacter sp. TaxID=2591384 RepID=UPI0026146F0D|nr:hypothetical protein [uncultured Dysosmobacter sp.]
MKKLFWGLFFVFLNFNLSVNQHTLNLLPPFVGYYLLYQGTKELDGESQLFRNVRPFAVGMGVYTAILWLGDLLGVSGGSGVIGGLLGLLAVLVGLYICWALIQAVRDMEERRGADLNSAAMRRAWIVLAVSQAACWLCVWLLSGLAILGLIAGLIGIILLLMAFWKGQKLYEAYLPQVSGPEL